MNDVFLSTYYGCNLDIFIIEEIIDLYLKVRRQGSFSQFVKAEDFVITIKAKYGTLKKKKRFFLFEEEYIDRG